MKRPPAFFRTGAALAFFLACATLAGCGTDYLDQFQPGDYPYDLAQKMQESGCTMTESAMAEFLGQHGAGISDIQATILNMAKAGYLTWDGNQSYTMVKGKTCATPPPNAPSPTLNQ